MGADNLPNDEHAAYDYSRPELASEKPQPQPVPTEPQAAKPTSASSQAAETANPCGQPDCKYCAGELSCSSEFHGHGDKRFIAWWKEQQRFERGLKIACFAAPVALFGTIWFAASGLAALVNAGILFTIFCMCVDSAHNGAGSGEFWVIVCRVIGSHAKLAFKVAWDIFLYLGALLGGTMLLKPEEESVSSGGPQSGELAGFLNTILFFPRMVLRAIIGIGRFFLFIGVLLMIWLTQFLLNHMTLFFATLAVLYVYWSIC